jgi:hypothetical protein
MSDLLRTTLTDAQHAQGHPRFPLKPSHLRTHNPKLWQSLRRDPFRHLRALQLALQGLAQEIDPAYDKHLKGECVCVSGTL